MRPVSLDQPPTKRLQAPRHQARAATAPRAQHAEDDRCADGYEEQLFPSSLTWLTSERLRLPSAFTVSVAALDPSSLRSLARTRRMAQVLLAAVVILSSPVRRSPGRRANRVVA